MAIPEKVAFFELSELVENFAFCEPSKMLIQSPIFQKISIEEIAVLVLKSSLVAENVIGSPRGTLGSWILSMPFTHDTKAKKRPKNSVLKNILINSIFAKIAISSYQHLCFLINDYRFVTN